MNPVLIVTHNCLELTKRSIASLLDQYVACYSDILIVDNGSTDGTLGWITNKTLRCLSYSYNAGVSVAWNAGLDILFHQPLEHVLVINNDVTLPEWFYSELLSYKAPFVTGISVDKMDDIQEFRQRAPLIAHPDFSAFLIRREPWEKIGPFDEGMKFYAQDCDYHIRACQAGVPLLAANLPFYHERSATLRQASPEEAATIQLQADRDRAYFFSKHGFPVGSDEYQKATASIAGMEYPFPGEVGR